VAAAAAAKLKVKVQGQALKAEPPAGHLSHLRPCKKNRTRQHPHAQNPRPRYQRHLPSQRLPGPLAMRSSEAAWRAHVCPRAEGLDHPLLSPTQAVPCASGRHGSSMRGAAGPLEPRRLARDSPRRPVTCADHADHAATRTRVCSDRMRWRTPQGCEIVARLSFGTERHARSATGCGRHWKAAADRACLARVRQAFI